MKKFTKTINDSNEHYILLEDSLVNT